MSDIDEAGVDDPGRAQFSVWLFFPDDIHEPELQWVDAKTAVERARSCALRPAAQAGIIRRIIITDGGDHTVFEWKFGEGVTFPPEARGAQPIP